MEFVQVYNADFTGSKRITFTWHIKWDASVICGGYGLDSANIVYTLQGNVLDRTAGGVWLLPTWAQTVPIQYHANAQHMSDGGLGDSVFTLTFDISNAVAGKVYNIYAKLVVHSDALQKTGGFSAQAVVDMSPSWPLIDFHQNEGFWLNSMNVKAIV
jgi:hypothetical protein